MGIGEALCRIYSISRLAMRNTISVKELRALETFSFLPIYNFMLIFMSWTKTSLLLKQIENYSNKAEFVTVSNTYFVQIEELRAFV